MFDSVTNFDTTIGDITGWNTSCITSTNRMFNTATDFNQDISGWDMSSVTDMDYMFVTAYAFNQNLSSWDTSSVTTMQGVFADNNFNGDISGWDTSKVTRMNEMFYANPVFNQPINSWNTSSITDMNTMFRGATSFNQDISSWDVSQVVDMSQMFYSASSFNQDISLWDVSSVNTMRDMFDGASLFDQDISLWDTSSVTDMHGLFANAIFNQNINLWNTGNVIDMSSMFSANTYFNQNIGSWNTSSATDMNSMFYYTSAFNQNIGSWNVSQVTGMNHMFDFVTLSTANYDAILNGWASQSVQSNVPFDAGNSKYSSAGLSARNDTLIGIYSWTITDGGMVIICANDTDCPSCEYCNAGICDYQYQTDNKIDCGTCEWCDGTGSCIGQDVGQDIKNECEPDWWCYNLSSYLHTDGTCGGSAVCKGRGWYQGDPINVSDGNICLNDTNYDVNPTIDYYCAIWKDCVSGEVSAPEYLVGYCSGICCANDWIAIGTIWNAPKPITVTEQAQTCQTETPNDQNSFTGAVINTGVKIIGGIGSVAIFIGVLIALALGFAIVMHIRRK
jgi:surface protein